jgi:hypothetical protein
MWLALNAWTGSNVEIYAIIISEEEQRRRFKYRYRIIVRDTSNGKAENVRVLL